MVVVLLKNVFSVVTATSLVVSTGEIIDFALISAAYRLETRFVPVGRQIICSWTKGIINVFLW